ncbi:MAG: hypothetical protein ACFNKE_06880 [Neisseria elongata]
MFGLFNGSNNDIVDDIEAVLRPMAGMAIAKKFALHDIVEQTVGEGFAGRRILPSVGSGARRGPQPTG